MNYTYCQAHFLRNMYNEPIDPQNETSPSEKCVVCMAQPLYLENMWLDDISQKTLYTQSASDFDRLNKSYYLHKTLSCNLKLDLMLIFGNQQVNKWLIMSHDKETEAGEDSIFTGLSVKGKVSLYKM